MERWGLSRDAAALHLLIISGDALTNDREFVPAGQREAVLREQEEAETALLAAWEETAKHIDPSATVEENRARTGLDRYPVEVYLRYLRRQAAAGDTIAE
jgi:hypothetical protein